jgi:hypothetical protein
MSDQKNSTPNAADEDQVGRAKGREKRLREREMNDIRYLLQSIQGRRFLWRLMGHCKVFESIWESSAKIHHNAGMQDIGHFVMAEIVAANEDAFLQMMKESKQGEI